MQYMHYSLGGTIMLATDAYSQAQLIFLINSLKVNNSLAIFFFFQKDQ